MDLFTSGAARHTSARAALKAIFPVAMTTLLVTATMSVSVAHSQTNVIAKAGGNYTITPANIKTTFRVKQLGIATVTGRFKSVKGSFTLSPRNPARSRVDVTIEAGSVSHLNEGVQKFMRGPELLHVTKFPKIRFRATRVKQTGPATATMTGKLTIHKKTHPITMKVKFSRAGRDPARGNRFTASFTAAGKFNRSTFGMTAGGGVVSDEVKFDIDVVGIRR